MWKVIKKDTKEYLYFLNDDNRKPILFNSVVEAKQFIAEYLKLTDFDMKVKGIIIEEVSEDVIQ